MAARVSQPVDGRPPDDQPLVERARRGDAAAYEELVRHHQHIAFRAALVFAGSPADAEEAAQDAFVKAWRALPRFRPGAPFRPWLLAIVANEARSRRRAAGRRASWLARAAAQESTAAGSGPVLADPAVAVLDRERTQELLGAIATLAERDRVVIELRYVLDLSEREMSAALGCRPGTVKSRLSRALARLREEMTAT